MVKTKKRRPQKVCTCGHARSRHAFISIWNDTNNSSICQFCFIDCSNFTQDNLKTLERLYEFQEAKKNSQ